MKRIPTTTAVATGQEPLPLRAWGAIRLLVWYAVAQLVIAVVILVGALLLRPGPSDMLGPVAPDELLIAAALGLPFGGLVVLHRLRRNLRGGSWPAIVAALGWRPAPRETWVGAAIAGAVLAAVYVLVVIPYLYPPSVHDTSALADLVTRSSISGRVVLAMVAVLVAPPVEEFLFRGILLSGFAASWGLWPAAAASTSLFALLHLDQVGSYWPAFVGILVMAVVAMGLRLRYRSLAPGIALHMSYNAVLMAVAAGTRS